MEHYVDNVIILCPVKSCWPVHSNFPLSVKAFCDQLTKMLTRCLNYLVRLSKQDNLRGIFQMYITQWISLNKLHIDWFRNRFLYPMSYDDLLDRASHWVNNLMHHYRSITQVFQPRFLIVSLYQYVYISYYITLYYQYQTEPCLTRYASFNYTIHE